MRHRASTIFRALVDIRSGEWTMAFLMSTNLFLVISTFSVVKPVRSSIFLQQYGASRLPYVYIATALLAGVVVALQSRLFRRFTIVWIQSFAYLFFAANLLFFWWAFQRDFSWLSAVFYLWVNVFTITMNTLFWILANNYYNSREAKRLYGIINSAGTVGGIISGFVVAQLVGNLGTENLLLLCLAVLAIGMGVTVLIARQGRHRFAAKEIGYVGDHLPESGRQRSAEPAGMFEVLKTSYPRYIALALFSALTISVIVEYQFNVVVEQTILQKDAKTAFFSTFFASVNTLTFILQFFLTGALLRRLGIGPSLMILPVAIIAGSVLFPLFPGMSAAIFLRISDGSLRYSITQSTRDILYMPIPKIEMERVKTFIDVFVQRVAKGAGSVLILLLATGLAVKFEHLSYVTLGLAVAWLGVSVALRRKYLNELRRYLRRDRRDEEPAYVQYLDPETTAALLAELDSGDEQRIIQSLELLERARAVDLRLVFRRWVREGSAQLQARALRRLAELGDLSVIEDAERILASESSEATEDAIYYLCETNAEGPMARMQQILQNSDQRIRAAAFACMANHGGEEAQKEVRQALEGMVRKSGPQATESRVLAAQTLGHINPPSTLHNLLIPLLQEESGEIVRAALSATERVLRRDFVPLIVRHLGHKEFSSPARRALAAHGDKIAGTLSDYLDDSTIPCSIRCKLPAIFAEIGSEKGVRTLVEHLDQENSVLRHAIAKALNGLFRKRPDLGIREEKIHSAVLRETSEAYEALRALYKGAPTDLSNMLGKESSNKARRRYRRSLQQVFRLLSLLYPAEDILNAYRALNGSQNDLRTGAVEFLDNLLPNTLGKALLPLVDDTIPVEEKLLAGAAHAR